MSTAAVTGFRGRCRLGIKFGWGEIFCTSSKQPWGPPSFLYKGYRLISGVKLPELGLSHPSEFSSEVKERVELYLYSPCGPSWPVLMWIFYLLTY